MLYRNLVFCGLKYDVNNLSHSRYHFIKVFLLMFYNVTDNLSYFIIGFVYIICIRLQHLRQIISSVAGLAFYGVTIFCPIHTFVPYYNCLICCRNFLSSMYVIYFILFNHTLHLHYGGKSLNPL